MGFLHKAKHMHDKSSYGVNMTCEFFNTIEHHQSYIFEHRMNINTAFYRILVTLSLIFLSFNSHAASGDNTINWAGCGITKKAFMSELAAAYETKTGIHINLQGGGATRGIRDTSAMKIDMGGSCRMALPEADSSELHAILHPVAWDALAIIVNKNNPVSNLSSKQIEKIYTGKLSNWSQVGGNNAPIHLYVRQGNISGVGYAIRQYLFANGQQKFTTQAKYKVKSSGPLERAVESDPQAMGITGVSSARKRNVKIIGFDGKTPTFENVKAGKYGLYRPLYLVTSPTPSKQVKDFIKYATSKEGRTIIRNNGTVPYHEALHLMSKMRIYGFGVE